MSEELHRKLTTVVATDVVEFSRLIHEDEEATLAALHAHRRELIDPLIESRGGRIANTAGDSLLIEFSSPVEAVRFAKAMQDGLALRNRDIPNESRIVFRIGINLGDVVEDGEDLLGDGVNVAARLEALADPGGIYLSAAVRDQLLDHLPIQLDDLGKVEVRNISRPVHVFRVAGKDRPRNTIRRLASHIPGRPLVIVSLIAGALFGAFIWWDLRTGFAPTEMPGPGSLMHRNR